MDDPSQKSTRALLVSPHLDDGVFSCGAWLAAHRPATVLTVFAGRPERAAMSTDWDRQCGFADAAQAMTVRYEEDQQALRTLGAMPLRLSFLDSQYGETPRVEAIADALVTAFDTHDGDTILLPLGLWHSDHVLTHEACLLAMRRLETLAPAAPPFRRRWIAYEDALYRRMEGAVQRRVAALAQQGIAATPVWLEAPQLTERAPAAAKREAVAAYASQLRAFGPDGYDDVATTERYWALTPMRAETTSWSLTAQNAA
ncbi:MAG: PIG-L family deacetylase [Janthinobacterium lividum]